MMLRNICRHHRQFGRVIWPFSQGHHVPSLSTHQQKAKYASAITGKMITETYSGRPEYA